MLTHFEPTLPATVMTPLRRRVFAIWGSIVLVAAAGVLALTGAGWVLWGAWVLSLLTTTGVVLLKPSIDIDPLTPDEILAESEHRRIKKYLSKLDQDRFQALEVSDTSDLE